LLLDVEAAGAGAGALLQPPKSSSWLTVGLLEEVPSLLPQPPKSSSFDTLVIAGALYVLVVAAGALYEVVGGAGAADSGVLQALLEPQASMLSKPDIADVGAGFGGGTGLDRLKAEAEVEFAGFEGAGAPISNRSPMPELVGTGDLVDICAGAGAGADVKSPKSPNPLDMRAGCGLAAGAAEGLGGGVGFASKKLPPLIELVRDAGEVRFEKAEGLGCCCCCCETDGPPKFKPPKASAMPPKEDVETAGDCIGGEAKPPKAFEED
jgi:hypothetical protein